MDQEKELLVMAGKAIKVVSLIKDEHIEGFRDNLKESIKVWVDGALQGKVPLESATKTLKEIAEENAQELSQPEPPPQIFISEALGWLRKQEVSRDRVCSLMLFQFYLSYGRPAEKIQALKAIEDLQSGKVSWNSMERMARDIILSVI